MSERRACRVLGVHRRTVRYQRRVRADAYEPTRTSRRVRADAAQLRERLRRLAAERPRWGYRRLHILLQREVGSRTPINHQRVQRLYRLEGLAIRRRKRVARGAWRAFPAGRHRCSPSRRGEAWAIDFMQDVLADGRRFRTRNVLDIVTRECLAIEVDTSLPGPRVVRLLAQLILWHGAPKRITLDNGPEFTGQALDAWAYAHHVTLDFIDPGKPMQNGYLASFNGKFRDEGLNVHWFRSLADARRSIEDWRVSYNTERPHSALCGRTPTQCALDEQAASLA
jgi:putative transposase